jgi:adsorption protein B
LAVWILISGLDDLFVGLCWLRLRKTVRLPTMAERDAARERRIAIFVPLWREHAVTGQMLERTVSTLHYTAYDIFVGVYPNDELTVRAVTEAARHHPRIQVAMTPHPGPTSKGDCLNCVYRRMQEHEERTGEKYEIIVTHDAEDVVHPESLRLISWFAAEYVMVQIPVLALPTPGHELTHGLYCDEFAEFQLKDIPVRQALDGFLPSNGVGCGFERKALEQLAESREGRIFDPGSLTEDYENGLQLHSRGYRQIFVPVSFENGAPVATREYFPRRRKAAARQRSRWIAGIALQGWERHGWRVPWRQRYWLWRDRKGLAGNLLSPVANLAYFYGLIRWRTLTGAQHWAALYACTLAIAAFQVGMRMWAARRIYGWRFAALAPVRVLWGNLINFQATATALSQFAGARLRGATLRWQKTDHSYPVHSVSTAGRPRLGEVLVRMRCVEMHEIDAALRTMPKGSRLGEHLVELRKLSEEVVYQALSTQAGIPLGAPPDHDVSPAAARTVPAEMAKRWRVLPYRVVMGQLHLATTEAPSEEMIRELGQATGLDLRFRLTQPGEFRKLVGMVSAK